MFLKNGLRCIACYDRSGTKKKDAVKLADTRRERIITAKPAQVFFSANISVMEGSTIAHYIPGRNKHAEEDFADWKGLQYAAMHSIIMD